MSSPIQQFNLIDDHLYSHKSFIDKVLDNTSLPIRYLLGRKVISLMNENNPIVRTEPTSLTKVIIFSFCVVIFPIGILSSCALVVKSLTNWEGRIKAFQTNTDAICAALANPQTQEKEILTLLNAGVNVNALDNLGQSLLMYASFKGLTEIVSLLLDRGANIGLLSKRGTTALMNAATAGHSEIVSLLLRRGAIHQIDAFDSLGRSALIYTIISKHIEVVEILLNHGANPNYANKDGDTALHFAACFGQKAMIKLLLTRGADINVVNSSAAPPFLKAYAIGRKNLGDELYQQSSSDCQAWSYLKAVNQHFGFTIEVKDGNRTIGLAGSKPCISYSSLLESIQNSQNWLKNAPPNWTSEDTEKLIRAIKGAIKLGSYRIPLKDKVKEALIRHQNHEIVIIPTGYIRHSRSAAFFGNLFAKIDRGHRNEEERNMQIFQMKDQINLEKSMQNLIEDRRKKDQESLYFDTSIHTDLQLEKKASIPKSVLNSDTCDWCAAKTASHIVLYLQLYEKFLIEDVQEAHVKTEFYSTNMYKALVQDDLLITIKNCIEKVADSNPHKHYVLACVYHHRKSKGLKVDPVMQLIETRAAKAVELSQHVKVTNNNLRLYQFTS